MMSQAIQEPSTEEMPLEVRERRVAERRLSALAAAVRDHERELSDRPKAVRYADLSLYRRLRQISGGFS
jgi:hypothetical protein